MMLSVHFYTLVEGEQFKQRLARPYLPCPTACAGFRTQDPDEAAFQATFA